jgi:glycosyltransferase involved in cell wall biosynthesis
MDFSVVIPVRNRPELVRRCVEGVLSGSCPRDRYELIVVDNGSTDGTADAAREAGARVVSEPEPNRCLARNRGAEEARADWVAFIDSDCVPDHDWLDQVGKMAAGLNSDDRVALVPGAVHDVSPVSSVGKYVALRRWFDQKKYLEGKGNYTRPFALTANFTVRRDVYLELGGLDAGLPYPGEDADFCWRLVDAGWNIKYAADAGVTHIHRSTVQGLWLQSCHWGIGQADLFAKWRDEWGADHWIEFQHMAWAVKGLVKAPWCMLTGRTPLEKRVGFYDFAANSGMAWGRILGGIRKGMLII